MYFAVDPCDARSLCETLRKEIEVHPDKRWMALIDGAFDYGRPAPPWADQGVALYGEDGDFRDLHRASPYLLPLDVADGSLNASVSRLSRHCRGRPMLSFVATDLSADQLASGWQRCLSVKTDGEQSFLLRFADTRSLPALANTLPSSGWALLTAGLATWLYVGRRGVLEQLPLIPKNIRAEQEITLDDASLGKLLDLSMPDAIIDIVVKQVPELLPTEGTSDIYHQATEVCQFAKEHHIDAMPDVVALMIYRLVGNRDLRCDEALLRILVAREYESGNLIHGLETLIE